MKTPLFSLKNHSKYPVERLFRLTAVFVSLLFLFSSAFTACGKKQEGGTFSSESSSASESASAGSSASGSVSDAPGSGSADTWESESLAFRINLPAGTEVDESDAEMPVFHISESSSLQICYSALYSVPLYEPADVMSAPEEILGDILSGTTEEYQYISSDLSSDKSYSEILYSASPAGEPVSGFLHFVACRNSPGLYILNGTCPESDPAAQTILQEMTASFRQTDNLNHGNVIITDAGTGVRVFTRESSFAGEYYADDDDVDDDEWASLVLNVSVNGDGRVTIRREDQPDSRAESYIDEKRASLADRGYKIVTEPYSVTKGLLRYRCLDVVTQEDNESDITTYAACDIGNSLMIVTGEQTIKGNQRELDGSVATVLGDFMMTADLVGEKTPDETSDEDSDE